MTCPYCKIDFQAQPWASGSRSIVCRNCRHYHEATTAQTAERAEAELFQTYKAIPINWRDFDSWRTDQQFLKPSPSFTG